MAREFYELFFWARRQETRVTSFFFRGRVERRQVIESFIDLERGGGAGVEAVKV